MKQRDLLFAGLLLIGVPVFAQNHDPSDPLTPIDPDKDPKVIFFQGFEQDWADWSTDSIDVIDKLYYYKDHESGQKADMWKSTEFDNLLERTDSIIPLYRGNVVKTDDPKDIEAGYYDKDVYDIITDEETDRYNTFKDYGEDGGTKVFQYVSDSNGFKSQWMQNPNTYSPEYRRNLFVRLLPNTIKPNTTYRLTFFVKVADANNGKTSAPKMNADLMRGYFHAEKPFTMGLEEDYDHYKYKTRFEWSKTDFSDGWEKVTYMSHYLNDSIANAYVFVDSYYWDDYEWTWAAGRPGNTSGKTLKYIQQPNKFFVRVSFAGDNTEYRFDNLSLTRSLIAGANYNADKLRIDFGFKTNIKDLADATPTKQLEVKFDDQLYNFEVWGLKKKADPADPDEWEEIYIRSAEYHNDGYLYMFTEYYDSDNDGEDDTPYKFDDYDEVRISFMNPEDPKLQLKYTGDGKSLANAFPFALDTNWIKAGKVIPNLVNEIGTPVPASAFKGVSSLKDLPPMLESAELVDNSFGNAPQDKFEFKFTRPVSFDNLGASSERVKVTVNGVTWNVSHKAGNDSILVVERPNAAPEVDGDVEIVIMQIYSTTKTGSPIKDQHGVDVIKHYHFGNFNRVPVIQTIKKSDWRKDISDELATSMASNSKTRPLPSTIWIYNDNSDYTLVNTAKDIVKGDGLTQAGTDGTANGGINRKNGPKEHKLGLLAINSGDCGMYLSSRGGSSTSSLYADFTIESANTYTLSFKAASWSTVNETKVYVYPKPATMTRANLEAAKAAASCIELPGCAPEGTVSDPTDNSSWPDKALDYSANFALTTPGDYIIEWVNTAATDGSKHYGVMIGNFTVAVAVDMSLTYTQALNKAVDDAQARLDLAEKDDDAKALYAGGYVYTTFKNKLAYYDYEPVGGFATSVNDKYPVDPAAWDKAKKDLNDATNAMKLRMDSVDAFVAKRKAVSDKLTAEQAKYSGLATYGALAQVLTEANAYDPKLYTGKEIYTYNDALQKAIDALDARIANNKKFTDEIARAAQLINDSARTMYAEFDALALVWGTDTTYNKTSAISATDDQLNEKYEELLAANNAYDFRVMAYNASTLRIKALEALSRKLSLTIGDNASVKAQFDTLEADNDALADIYKTAITLELYKRAAANPADASLDSIDLTPFIKNYNLYVTVKGVAERTADGYYLPNNRYFGGKNDWDTYYSQPEYSYPIMHAIHQYDNHKPIWVIILENEYSNLYPGWTIKSFNNGNGNHCMVSPDDCTNYPNLSRGVPVFDGMVATDWNSKAELKSEIEDLPSGLYTLGVQFKKNKSDNDNASSITTTTKVNDKDSILSVVVKNEVADGDSVWIDSITVLDGKMSVDAMIRSHEGHTQVDNFMLAFRPIKEGVNYTTLQAGLQEKIDELLTIVDAKKAVAANVEYYTLGGVKLLAPKSGEILIRKTTQANGKVVVDKVLIK